MVFTELRRLRGEIAYDQRMIQRVLHHQRSERILREVIVGGGIAGIADVADHAVIRQQFLQSGEAPVGAYRYFIKRVDSRDWSIPDQARGREQRAEKKD